MLCILFVLARSYTTIIFDMYNFHIFFLLFEANTKKITATTTNLSWKLLPTPSLERDLKKKIKGKVVSVESLCESCQWLKWNTFHPRLFVFCFMLPFVVYVHCCFILDVFCSMFSLSIILIAFEATVFHYFNKSYAIYQENSNSKYMYVYVNFDLHWNKSTLRRIKFTKTTNVQNRFEWMSNKNRIASFYWIIVRYFIFDIFYLEVV